MEAELEASRSVPTSALLAVFGPEARADVGIRPYGSLICFFKWQFEKHLHFQFSTFNFQFCLHLGKMNTGSSLTVCGG